MKNLFHAKTGPLTRELLREPAQFGLGQLPVIQQPDAIARMVCGYCSTGCSLDIHLQDGAAVNLSPSTNYPVNLGMACPKGWEALTVMDADDRATVPLRRNAQGGFDAIDWSTAMQEFVRNFQTIQKNHGKHSVAFISTGQLVTEEMAFLGALTKFGMGLRHGDGNTRQCMATAVVAYKQSFGFDAPPYTYADFEQSDVIVLFGSNLCIAHPIMWERVMRNPHSPQIIVVDPRSTETAMQSTLHLNASPKSDQTLCYGVARELIERGWIDRDFIEQHTREFEAFREFVAPFTFERVSLETGLSPEQLEQFVRAIHNGQRVSFWWTMGVNQSHQGVRTAQAIINLALMTGNIGRPGTGANSITGQCNAMGSRLFSNTTNLLGGHSFSNPSHRAKVAAAAGIAEDNIPAEDSWAYNEIMDGIDRGEIRGLWVVCTNTAHSWINQNRGREILKKLDYLVVQDIYHSTETAVLADLVLPAAGWAEKDGTFINSERRFGVVRKVRRAPGQALSDFNILRLIAQAWGCGEMFADWQTPADVFRILQKCSLDQPCDISGIRDYAEIDQRGGIQWPWTAADAAAQTAPQSSSENNTQSADDSSFAAVTERRLFSDGRFCHDDGRARFIFAEPNAITEPADSAFPFLLNTGRGSASQWHTQTRTSKSAVLRKLYPSANYAEINPADAAEIGVSMGDMIQVSSRRGSIQVQAVVTRSVRPRQVFIPMHSADTNQLTDSVFDPYSKQPSYKTCAVNVQRVK